LKPDGDRGFPDGDFLLEELTEVSDGWTATVVVPDSCRWFEGHFPGEPILPGVGQVDLVARLYEELSDGSTAWGGLPKLRLNGQVKPGERLAVTLRRGDTGVAFSIRAAAPPGAEPDAAPGRRISDGLLALGPEPEAEMPGHESPTGLAGAAALDPPRLLPHEPPSLLALEVIGFDNGGAVTGDGDEDGAGPAPAILCRGRVPADNAAARAGQAGTWMAIELAAQASGLLEAALHRAAGAELDALPVGYLVRVRGARFTHPTLPADADLLARVELQGRGGPLSLYRTTIGIPGGFALASASLGTFVPEG